MDYRVVITDAAQHELAAILECPHRYFSPAERLAYIEDIERVCATLDHFPNRYRRHSIDGEWYHVLPYKAHRIIYRIDETERLVYVVAIRASALRNPMQL